MSLLISFLNDPGFLAKIIDMYTHAKKSVVIVVSRLGIPRKRRNTIERQDELRLSNRDAVRILNDIKNPPPVSKHVLKAATRYKKLVNYSD